MNPVQSNPIAFAKMQALGNDFVVLHSPQPDFKLPTSRIVELANRHQGIGFDQLLIIEPSQQADFFCRIFNADGSEAEQCGNGLRCIARYIKQYGLSAKNIFSIETIAGIFPITIKNDATITVTMGIPVIHQQAKVLNLSPVLETATVSTLNIGNPHAIMRVSDLHRIETHIIGSAIATHPFFSQGTNVGFMQIINNHHLILRTFERGTGNTLSCGSNACAAAATGIIHQWLQSPVNVECCLGFLEVQWEGENTPIDLTGPAEFVFTGEIRLLSN